MLGMSTRNVRDLNKRKILVRAVAQRNVRR
jgi:hypothetical protein